MEEYEPIGENTAYFDQEGRVVLRVSTDGLPVMSDPDCEICVYTADTCRDIRPLNKTGKLGHCRAGSIFILIEDEHTWETRQG